MLHYIVAPDRRNVPLSGEARKRKGDSCAADKFFLLLLLRPCYNYMVRAVKTALPQCAGCPCSAGENREPGENPGRSRHCKRGAVFLRMPPALLPGRQKRNFDP